MNALHALLFDYKISFIWYLLLTLFFILSILALFWRREREILPPPWRREPSGEQQSIPEPPSTPALSPEWEHVLEEALKKHDHHHD